MEREHGLNMGKRMGEFKDGRRRRGEKSIQTRGAGEERKERQTSTANLLFHWKQWTKLFMWKTKTSFCWVLVTTLWNHSFEQQNFIKC